MHVFSNDNVSGDKGYIVRDVEINYFRNRITRATFKLKAYKVVQGSYQLYTSSFFVGHSVVIALSKISYNKKEISDFPLFKGYVFSVQEGERETNGLPSEYIITAYSDLIKLDMINQPMFDMLNQPIASAKGPVELINFIKIFICYASVKQPNNQEIRIFKDDPNIVIPEHLKKKLIPEDKSGNFIGMVIKGPEQTYFEYLIYVLEKYGLSINDYMIGRCRQIVKGEENGKPNLPALDSVVQELYLDDWSFRADLQQDSFNSTSFTQFKTKSKYIKNDAFFYSSNRRFKLGIESYGLFVYKYGASDKLNDYKPYGENFKNARIIHESSNSEFEAYLKAAGFAWKEIKNSNVVNMCISNISDDDKEHKLLNVLLSPGDRVNILVKEQGELRKRQYIVEGYSIISSSTLQKNEINVRLVPTVILCKENEATTSDAIINALKPSAKELMCGFKVFQRKVIYYPSDQEEKKEEENKEKGEDLGVAKEPEQKNEKEEKKKEEKKEKEKESIPQMTLYVNLSPIFTHEFFQLLFTSDVTPSSVRRMIYYFEVYEKNTAQGSEKSKNIAKYPSIDVDDCTLNVENFNKFFQSKDYSYFNFQDDSAENLNNAAFKLFDSVSKEIKSMMQSGLPKAKADEQANGGKYGIGAGAGNIKGVDEAIKWKLLDFIINYLKVFYYIKFGKRTYLDSHIDGLMEDGLMQCSKDMLSANPPAFQDIVKENEGKEKSYQECVDEYKKRYEEYAKKLSDAQKKFDDEYDKLLKNNKYITLELAEINYIMFVDYISDMLLPYSEAALGNGGITDYIKTSATYREIIFPKLKAFQSIFKRPLQMSLFGGDIDDDFLKSYKFKLYFLVSEKTHVIPYNAGDKDGAYAQIKKSANELKKAAKSFYNSRHFAWADLEKDGIDYSPSRGLPYFERYVAYRNKYCYKNFFELVMASVKSGYPKSYVKEFDIYGPNALHKMFFEQDKAKYSFFTEEEIKKISEGEAIDDPENVDVGYDVVMEGNDSKLLSEDEIKQKYKNKGYNYEDIKLMDIKNSKKIKVNGQDLKPGEISQGPYDTKDLEDKISKDKTTAKEIHYKNPYAKEDDKGAMTAKEKEEFNKKYEAINVQQDKGFGEGQEEEKAKYEMKGHVDTTKEDKDKQAKENFGVNDANELGYKHYTGKEYEYDPDSKNEGYMWKDGEKLDTNEKKINAGVNIGTNPSANKNNFQMSSNESNVEINNTANKKESNALDKKSDGDSQKSVKSNNDSKKSEEQSSKKNDSEKILVSSAHGIMSGKQSHSDKNIYQYSATILDSNNKYNFEFKRLLEFQMEQIIENIHAAESYLDGGRVDENEINEILGEYK